MFSSSFFLALDNKWMFGFQSEKQDEKLGRWFCIPNTSTRVLFLPPSLPPSLPLSLSPSLSPFLPSFLLSIPVLGLFHTTEVQLIYNAVLVLGVQQSDSVYIYTELLFRFFFIIGYYNKSNIVPCVIQ